MKKNSQVNQKAYFITTKQMKILLITCRYTFYKTSNGEHRKWGAHNLRNPHLFFDRFFVSSLEPLRPRKKLLASHQGVLAELCDVEDYKPSYDIQNNISL